MALIKFGGGVIQMSGSIAGDTFARNRFGNYSRARTKPINPNTARQIAVRSALTELVARWAQVLTATQRTAWNLYASSVGMKNRLGEVVYLSGMNQYVRSNSFYPRYGLTPIDAGPTLFELPEKDPQFAVAASAASQEITVTFDDTMAWCSEDEAYFIMYQGQPQNAQRNFFGGPWRTIGYFEGDSIAPVVSPLTKPVSFAVAEGQRIWCYARILRADGRLSEAFEANCFCGA